MLAHRVELVGERAHVGGPAVGQRLHRARDELRVVRVVGVGRRRRVGPSMSSVSSTVSGGTWMTSNRAERSRSRRSVRAV